MSNVMNPDGTHKIIAGYSHTAGLQERDRRIAKLQAENAKLQAQVAEKYSSESHAIAATLGRKNLRLRAENAKLQLENEKLKADYDLLNEEYQKTWNVLRTYNPQDIELEYIGFKSVEDVVD